MSIKIHQLRYFLLVADHHSYRAAASLAARSQPAISQAVHELEALLGQALFERGRKAELTPFGREHYPAIRSLVDHHDRTLQALFDSAERKTGQVALASIPSFAGRYLPGMLLRFADSHPEISVAVEDGTAIYVQRRVLDRQVDFGIGTDAELSDELSFQPLTEDQMGMVCHISHLLAQQPGACRWESLRPYTLITNGTFRQLLDPAAVDILQSARFHVPNIVSLLALVRAGLGVTLLPQLALFGQDEALVFRPLEAPAVTRSIGLIHLRNQTPRPAVQALMDAIRHL